MTDNSTPLGLMTQRGPTVLWNDSATFTELTTAIAWGAVGATCNPVIALAAIRADLPRWQAADRGDWQWRCPTATESQIGWKVVEEVSLEAAKLPRARVRGAQRPQRPAVDADRPAPRTADAKALADQAEYFSSLAPNIIVKIPATKVGVEAIEEATYRGVSINVTVSFTVAQAVARPARPSSVA